MPDLSMARLTVKTGAARVALRAPRQMILRLLDRVAVVDGVQLRQLMTLISSGQQQLDVIESLLRDVRRSTAQQTATLGEIRKYAKQIEQGLPSSRGDRKAARDVARSFVARRKARDLTHFVPDELFLSVAQEVKSHERTLLGYDRLYVLWQAAKNARHLRLPAAEIGSYRGGSAYFLARAFVALTGEETELHVFDTFEGHPEDKITEQDDFHEPGMFNTTSYDEVKSYLSVFSKAQVHQGEFSASIQHVEDKQYSLIHIDTDLYQPTVDCLEYYWPRLPTGGVVVVDDYFSKKCPGVPEAVAAFFENRGGYHAWDVQTEQMVLIKA